MVYYCYIIFITLSVLNYHFYFSSSHHFLQQQQLMYCVFFAIGTTYLFNIYIKNLHVFISFGWLNFVIRTQILHFSKKKKSTQFTENGGGFHRFHRVFKPIATIIVFIVPQKKKK